ncbi:MAG: FKBP-type peptidyl-prolyl cis-trans isomerase [Bacteroidales bacterium]|nr:FKBP-type peptidyl-prolyl cis-trans isomerase [Bacteroidales bacterium]MBN2758689.1 FKBP-type peptidyl-prolyl cis-trans isomerase [Bacteroidales bacterium]
MKLKILQLAFVLTAVIFASCNKSNTSGNFSKDVALNSEIDSISYFLGIDIANSMKKAGVLDININTLAAGFMQIIDGDSVSIDPKDARMKLQLYFQKKQQMKMEDNLKEGQAFLEENKTKEGVITTATGLQYKVITEGKGQIPTNKDQVKVHYKGTLLNGETFDSSYDRGEPATFPVTGVVKGWQEALQIMPVGSKWIVYVPSELAYGKRGSRGSIEPNMALIFEMELLEIVQGPEEKIEPVK